jgi:CHAT domain-containing protein/Flp pilus assembly protein TadD
MVKIVFLLTIIFFSNSIAAPAADIVGSILEGINDGIKSGLQRQPQERRSYNNTSLPSGRQQQRGTEIDLGTRLYNEGIQLDERGQDREAIVKLKQALDIAMRNNVSLGAMNCLLLLGMAHENLKETNIAINYFKEALRIAKEVNDTVREKSSLAMLAICYNELGDISTSITYKEESLLLAERLGDFKEQINVLSSLSGNFLVSDKIKSISYSEKALQLSHRIGDKQLEAQHLIRFSMQLLSMGNAQKALDYLSQAMTLAKETNNHAMVVDCTLSIGEAYSYLGDYPQAILWLEQAYKLQENQKNAIGQFQILMGLGHIYMAIGDYNKAIDYLERSESIALRLVRLDLDTAYIHTWLAICHLQVGEKTVAHELIKNADSHLLLIALFDLLDGNPKKVVSGIPKEELLGYPKELFAQNSKEDIIGIYTIFGLAYEKLGDFKVAEHCFKVAIEVMEYQRDVLQIDSKSQFLGGKTFPPYDRLTAYEGLARISTPENALVYSEEMKARSFLEIVARKQDTLLFRIPDNLKSQEEGFDSKIFELRRAQESAISNNNKSRITNSEQELNRVKQERERFIERLYSEYPNYASIKYPKPLDLSKLKMNKDEVLLEYLITETRTLGWLVKDNKIVKSISINISRKEIESQIDLYRSQIERKNEPKDEKFDPTLGYKLYQLLIKDFASAISPSDKLIIIPDKVLGLLPFEAIVTKLPDNQARITPESSSISLGVKFLGDDYNISYYQSASAMTLVRNLKKGGRVEKNIFILADPVFELTDERLESRAQIQADGVVSKQMSAVQDSSGIRFPRLKETAWLATQLTALFEDKGVESIADFEANESNVKSRDLSKYKYVVFASHGVTESMVPGLMEPALVLGQFGNKRGDDGFLSMTEVMGLNLNCDIAALTACLTGKGRLVSGEGVMGLARAFQYAGSKAVLASLWSVSEKSSMILTDRFFHYLKNGTDPVASLKNARNDVRKEGYDHPFYWAPFVLIGEVQN